jgi:hypothetical protein
LGEPLRTQKKLHLWCSFFCGLRRAIRGSLRSYLMRFAHFGTARKRAAATIPLA